MYYYMWISLELLTLLAIVRCSKVNQPINWSQVTGFERLYSYPAFVEVAGSQCDLTVDICDVPCCSDTDCSEEQKLSFDCMGGLSDGEKAEILPSWNCKHHSLEEDNFWVPLLCYVLTNTPYLGEYFVTENKIESLSNINRAVKVKHKFHYNQLYTNNESDAKYYKFGSPIKTKTYLDNNIYELDYLKLPRSVIGGSICSELVKLKYLENMNTNCLRKISKKQCEMGYLSPFSALSYMVFDTSLNSSNLSIPQISQDYLGENRTDTYVKYVCLNNGSAYLTFSKSIFKEEGSSTRLRDKSGSIINCTLPSSELVHSFYNDSTEMCQNVIVSVVYNFKWNNTKILNLSATYRLVDIPVTPDALLRSSHYVIDSRKVRRGVMNQTEFYVTQSFATTFEHEHIVMSAVNSSKATESLQGSFKRSGNPGYEIGLPLLSWNLNATNGTGVIVERAVIGIWQNGHNGCRDVSHVTFGYDVITRCSLELEEAELEDCTSIRSRIEALQESLVTGKFLAGGGAFPDPQNASLLAASLVPILRDDINVQGGASDDGNETTTEDCDLMPTSRATHVLYTTVMDASGRPVHRVVGAKTSFIFDTWFGQAVNRRHVVLTSSVTFVSVPVHDPPQTSRFWHQVSSPDESDTAWLNILHVLDDVMSGDVSVQVGTTCVATVVIAVVLSSLFKRRR